jgi:hypothetical protein
MMMSHLKITELLFLPLPKNIPPMYLTPIMIGAERSRREERRSRDDASK